MFHSNSLGFREIPRGTFRVVLEYMDSVKSLWRTVAEYEFTFDEWSSRELAKGAGFGLGASGSDRTWPKDWKDQNRLLIDSELEEQNSENQAMV